MAAAAVAGGVALAGNAQDDVTTEGGMITVSAGGPGATVSHGITATGMTATRRTAAGWP